MGTAGVLMPKKVDALGLPAQTFSEKHLMAISDTWRWGKGSQCSGVSGLMEKVRGVVVVVFAAAALVVAAVVVIVVEKERKKGRKKVVCSCCSCKRVVIIFVICWSGMPSR